MKLKTSTMIVYGYFYIPWTNENTILLRLYIPKGSLVNYNSLLLNLAYRTKVFLRSITQGDIYHGFSLLLEYTKIS